MPPAPRWVLVPGLGLDAGAWRPTIESLSAHGVDITATTVATLPGYGVPASRREGLTPRRLARRLLEHSMERDRRHVFVGHSASCQVVAHAAALAGPRVSRLVLVGPTTDPRASSWWALARRWLATATHEPPRQVPSLLRQYRRTGLATMARAMEAARRDRIDAVLPGVRCPVLVVRGLHDRIAPPDWVEELADAAPTGTHLTLPAGGHMVPLTHGSLVASACTGHTGQPR